MVKSNNISFLLNHNTYEERKRGEERENYRNYFRKILKKGIKEAAKLDSDQLRLEL